MGYLGTVVIRRAGASHVLSSHLSLRVLSPDGVHLEARAGPGHTSVVLASTMKTALLGLHTGAGSRGAAPPRDKRLSREQQEVLPKEPVGAAVSVVARSGVQCSLELQML